MKSLESRARQLAGLKRGGPPKQKGMLNKVTVEVKEMTRALVESPAYRETLKARLETGALAPGMEQVLWYYAYGKPKETVALEGSIETVTDIELKARLALVLVNL